MIFANKYPYFYLVVLDAILRFASNAVKDIFHVVIYVSIIGSSQIMVA